MRDPRYSITHEIVIDPETPGFNLLGPEGCEWFNKFFGSNATVSIEFTSHWEKQPAEPEAGFPLPYYEVYDGQFDTIYASTTFCGEAYGKDLKWEDLKKEDQDFLMEFCIEYAATCGEEPTDLEEVFNEEVGYGPNDND